MKKALIELKGISKNFAGVKALQDVDLTIYEGETRCLAGENGCGKSTLIKIIAGVYVPNGGTIVVDGKEYSKLTTQQAIDAGIQIIYQDFAIFPNLTVAENIAMTSEKYEKKKLVDWKSIRSKTEKIMSRVGIDIDMDARLGDLSVADKQLVAICRALLWDARLLIMDEPTTALTKKEVVSLFKIVRDLQKKGISILFVSHKLEEVFEIADELTIIRNGRKVIDGSMKDFDNEKFIYYMTGRKLVTTAFRGPERREKLLLEVKNISSEHLFKNISFELYAGEIIGITGLLGSGRSELAKALFGMIPLCEGEIYIDGEKVTLRNVRDAIKNGIACVPEDWLTEGLFMPHTIGENMMVAAYKKMLSRTGFIQRKRMDEEVERWIDELKIVTPSGRLPVQALSGGNQQKVVIAKWIETEPKILILNSPTVGVDVGSKADIHAYARKLADAGMGVIIISDDISEVLQNCNRILVMNKGHITHTCDTSGMTDSGLNEMLVEG